MVLASKKLLLLEQICHHYNTSLPNITNPKRERRACEVLRESPSLTLRVRNVGSTPNAKSASPSSDGEALFETTKDKR
jgi:hypothetical protein